MKEESLSRTKVYEQLESSLCETERNNSDLSRKHELDKKRMQSMGENIDYLERKCEELSTTLDSIRDSNKKNYNGKINQSGYFNFGSSDSSEDDSGLGYGFRRRSQSLQDLRDYTPSPDDLDSNHSHSNSPDLKTSEAEFVGTLEARVEELIGAKKKEVEKISQLENQVRILIQENSNLQQKLIQVTTEKNEQIEDLRIQVLDNTTVLSHRTPTRVNTHSILPTPIMSPERNDECPAFAGFMSGPDNYLSSPFSGNPTGFRNNAKPMCKRCSTEINILNLVNSIEIENEDYSSLEFEMARAEEAQALNSSFHRRPNGNNFDDLVEPSVFHNFRYRKAMTLDAEEDPCLVKDFGPEVFMKSCDDVDGTSRNRKLKLPAKLFTDDKFDQPESLHPTEETNGEQMVLDETSSVEPIASVKKRSKFWWFGYCVLLVLGIMEIAWNILSFTIFLIIGAIFPKRSHSASVAASRSPRPPMLPFRPNCRKVN